MCFRLQELYSQIRLLLSAHCYASVECFCLHLSLELVLLDTDFFRFPLPLCQSSLMGTKLLLEALHSVRDQRSIFLLLLVYPISLERHRARQPQVEPGSAAYWFHGPGQVSWILWVLPSPSAEWSHENAPCRVLSESNKNKHLLNVPRRVIDG